MAERDAIQTYRFSKDLSIYFACVLEHVFLVLHAKANQRTSKNALESERHRPCVSRVYSMPWLCIILI